MQHAKRILTKPEYALLYKAGYASDAVSKYSCGHTVPHLTRQRDIIALLGRDPWDGRTATSAGRPRKPEPVAAPPAPVSDCQLPAPPATQRVVAVNACDTDAIPTTPALRSGCA